MGSTPGEWEFSTQFEEVRVTRQQDQLHWSIRLDDCGRPLDRSVEQSLASFRTSGPRFESYPFFQTVVPESIVLALTDGVVPAWWKPLAPAIVKVFEAAQHPDDQGKFLEESFLRDVPVDEIDGFGFPPIWYAVRYGDPNSVLALLGAGARLTRIHLGVPGYESLLHGAVTRGYPGLVQALLDQGVAPNLADAQGKTPLFCLEREPSAWRRTMVEVTRILLEAGADPLHRSASGHTALDWARLRGWSEVLPLLGG